MRFLFGLSGLLMWVLASSASALEECSFSFDVDTQSTDYQALVQDAASSGGFWRPINEAPDDVRAIAKYVGRLDICLRTLDGKPAKIVQNGQTHEIPSPFTTKCTAALLPDNKLLTNGHCFFDPKLTAAGFKVVDQVRINFGYVEEDLVADVQTFAVANREVAHSEKLDAMVLQIFGNANERLGGHFPLTIDPEATPRKALTMVHHPLGQPMQFSSGTCQIHPRQDELPATSSVIRHRCESAGGSSGGLLLDARTLAIVGLHNTGGLGATRGFNGGHKIEPINEALSLGMTVAAAPAPASAPEPKIVIQEDPNKAANDALIAAFLEQDLEARSQRLNNLLRDFPDAPAAGAARAEIARISAMAQPETTPKLIRVKADGTGDYKTVASAVEAAEPGNIIQVYPGTYRGEVIVDKPIKIVGIGERDEIILRHSGVSVITWRAQSGEISNLKIEQTGGLGGAIVFRAGSADVIGNDLSSNEASAVFVRDASNPKLTENVIHSNGQNGIVFYLGATGVAENNKIFGNGFNGILVTTEAKPVVLGNKIFGNKHSGVLVQDEGSGTFTGNRIYGNIYNGLAVTKGGKPSAIENEILNNSRSGIAVYGGGAGIYEGNTIHKNDNYGLWVIDGGSPVFLENKIRENAKYGALISDKAKGRFEGNEITGNREHGVVVMNSADPYFVRNRVTENKRHGIFVKDQGKGSYIGNDLRGNASASLDVLVSAGTVIQRDNRVD